MAPAAGTLLTLTIEKPAAGGRMIARADGQIVLVGGAIPGERVVARVERVAKGVIYAWTATIEEPSADRRAPASDPLCGGCLYNHITYERQREIKARVVEDAFARIARVDVPAPVPVLASREDGYRMRARLHLRDGRLGFFREGTHDLCDARGTHQLLPETIDVLELAIASRQMDVGLVEVDLSENIAGSERAIALNGRVAAGDGYVHDTLAVEGHDVSWRRHVLAFFQGNRYLLGNLVNHVVSQIDRGSNVVDLYAGSGLFSLPAATARGAHVVSVEGDRAAAADLAWNAGRSGGNIEARHLAVEAFMAAAPARSGTIVVDPPRTGMSKEAVGGILRCGPERIVYVSCDVATLARDTRRIVDAGYAIARVDAFDMFPNTPHVETVVVFNRG